MSTTFWHCRQYALRGLPIPQWHDRPRLNREHTQEGAMCPHRGAPLVFVHQCRSHFTSTSCVSWTHLSWGRNCMRQQLSKLPCLSMYFYASIRSVEFSPQHSVVHNSSPFTADIGMLQRSRLPTTSAATLQWSLLQLLLPDCVRFACCMLTSTCDHEHAVQSTISTKVGHHQSSPAPLTSHFHACS